MTDENAKPADDAVNPRRITLSAADWQAIIPYLKQNPRALLFDKKLRTFLAKRRAKRFEKADRWQGGQHRMVDFAIRYNEGHMNRFLESHVVRLIRPLSIIDPIYENVATAKLLSVGPRNENEIFHLCAYGFDIMNIEAIDLVSNSPLVRIMDMHELQYADATFDVVISGWTLPYSRDPKRALSEKLRVLRPGGLLCVGLTRVPPDSADHQNIQNAGAISYLSADQILFDIGEASVEVAFRHEPLDKLRKGAILLIVRKTA